MDQEFSLGEWISKRRNFLGLTQEALAKQVGYSVAMIRKIEDDKRRPSRRAAALWAKALEIPEDQQEAFLKVARQERAFDQLGVVDKEPFPWQLPSEVQTNLPIPATMFVGRETELAKLISLIQDPNCRLITLVGLAGIGKTRLALQAAHTQLHRFSDGVFFVSLAPLTSHTMIGPTIANAIGLQLHGAASPEVHLLSNLQAKQMLLVLDNFEHLMEGVGLLTAIKQGAPGLHLLVTSRERLNLQGEWVFELEGLSYPLKLEDSSQERVETYEAVQLFLQSAMRADSRFILNEQNRQYVLRICQLMEGMPLGLNWQRPGYGCSPVRRSPGKSRGIWIFSGLGPGISPSVTAAYERHSVTLGTCSQHKDRRSSGASQFSAMDLEGRQLSKWLELAWRQSLHCWTNPC